MTKKFKYGVVYHYGAYTKGLTVTYKGQKCTSEDAGVSLHAFAILIGLQYYDEIMDELVMDDNELSGLTYRSELIHVSLPYIKSNLDSVFTTTSHRNHPLLNQLAHQTASTLFWKYIDDTEFDKARENLYFFLTELRKIAPQFFWTQDEYGKLPIERLESLHTNHSEVNKLLNLFYPFDLDVDDYYKYGLTKEEYQSNEEFGKWVDDSIKPRVMSYLEKYNFTYESQDSPKKL